LSKPDVAWENVATPFTLGNLPTLEEVSEPHAAIKKKNSKANNKLTKKKLWCSTTEDKNQLAKFTAVSVSFDKEKCKRVLKGSRNKSALAATTPVTTMEEAAYYVLQFVNFEWSASAAVLTAPVTWE